MLRRRRAGVRYSSLSLDPRRGARARRASGATCRSRCSCSRIGSLVIAMARPVDDRQPSRPAGRRSSSRSTSRAACAPPTSRPTGCSPPRRPRPSFIERQGSSTQIGIVAFAGFAEIVQAPTTDQEVLLDVVDEPRDRAPDRGRQRDPRVARCDRRDRPGRRARARPRTIRPGQRAGAGPERRVCPGHHRPPDRWREQRRAGAGRGRRSRPPRAAIRVYTIGFGTDDPGAQSPRCGPQFIGSEPGDSRPRRRWRRLRRRRGRRWRRRRASGGAIDEETLKAVADATGGDRTTRPRAPTSSSHGLRRPADEPDHEARGDGDQRRLRRARGAARRRGDPARSGLAPAAVAPARRTSRISRFVRQRFGSARWLRAGRRSRRRRDRAAPSAGSGHRAPRATRRRGPDRP